MLYIIFVVSLWLFSAKTWECKYFTDNFRIQGCLACQTEKKRCESCDKEAGYQLSGSKCCNKQEGIFPDNHGDCAPCNQIIPGCKICKSMHDETFCFECLAEESSCIVGMKCGNGVQESLIWQECDDGNMLEGDGCSKDCTIEQGWHCISPSSLKSICSKSTPTRSEQASSTGNSSPICGDGVKEGNQICDDGNRLDDDGCSQTCSIEKGFTCRVEGCLSVCRSTCGNTEHDSGQECDDGNSADGDGCSSSCQEEEGWRCTKWGESSCQKMKHPSANKITNQQCSAIEGCKQCSTNPSTSDLQCSVCDMDNHYLISGNTCCNVHHLQFPDSSGGCTGCHAVIPGCFLCAYRDNTGEVYCTACDFLSGFWRSEETCCNGTANSYPDGEGGCTGCPPGCQSCSYNGQYVQCSSCAENEGFYLSGRICCDTISQLFPSDDQCQHCSQIIPGCTDCTYNAETRSVGCTSCNTSEGYELSGTTCCDGKKNSFPDGSDGCTGCSIGCLMCLNSRQCTICEAGWELSGTICCDTSLDLFPDGEGACLACHVLLPGCLTCMVSLEGTICTQCDVASRQFISGIKCCTSGHDEFPDGHQGCQSCSQANAGCITCIYNPDTLHADCVICDMGQGYQISGVYCCNSNEKSYPDGNGGCTSCPIGCKVCADASTCITCDHTKGYQLSLNTCCNVEEGMYPDGVGKCGQCSEVFSGCSECAVVDGDTNCMDVKPTFGKKDNMEFEQMWAIDDLPEQPKEVFLSKDKFGTLFPNTGKHIYSIGHQHCSILSTTQQGPIISDFDFNSMLNKLVLTNFAPMLELYEEVPQGYSLLQSIPVQNYVFNVDLNSQGLVLLQQQGGILKVGEVKEENYVVRAMVENSKARFFSTKLCNDGKILGIAEKGGEFSFLVYKKNGELLQEYPLMELIKAELSGTDDCSVVGISYIFLMKVDVLYRNDDGTYRLKTQIQKTDPVSRLSINPEGDMVVFSSINTHTTEVYKYNQCLDDYELINSLTTQHDHSISAINAQFLTVADAKGHLFMYHFQWKGAQECEFKLQSSWIDGQPPQEQRQMPITVILAITLVGLLVIILFILVVVKKYKHHDSPAAGQVKDSEVVIGTTKQLSEKEK